MPSLLAFVLRRNRGKKSSSSLHQDGHRDDASVTSRTSNSSDLQDHLYNHHRIFHPNQSPVPPAIQASQSSSDETCGTSYNDNQLTKGFEIQTTASSNDEFFCLTRPRGVVVTPDGLKTRRPIVDVQVELGLNPADHIRTKSGSRGSHKCNTTANTNLAIVPVGQPKERCIVGPLNSDIQQTNAPTALHVIDSSVGSIFHQQQDYFPSQFQQKKYQPCGNTTVLPPPPSRSWSSDGTWLSPTPASNPSSDPSSFGAPRFSWQTTPSAESPNLVPGQARTAVGYLVALAAQHQKRSGQLDPPAKTIPQEPMDRRVHSPATTNKKAQKNGESSRCLDLVATPPQHAKEEPSGALARMESITKTLASTTDRICSTPTEAAYDNDWQYSPQEECVESMFSPMFPNKSNKGTSKASVTATFGCPESTNGMMVLLEQHPYNADGLASPANNLQEVHALDGDILRLKARNQKRGRDDLMIAALERLQDDPQLVSDVQNLGMMVDPALNQNLDGCLLTGMNERQRERITEKLDLILEELDSGLSVDEFFSSSPFSSTNCYRTDGDHTELREALQFCRVLVQMAIPEEEKHEGSLMGTTDIGRWQFLPGLREAVGIRAAVTPDARSTSCFSLPEDCNAETPMTSNLSFCCNSTLTTKDPSALPVSITEGNDKKKGVQNGLDLRQAINEFASRMNRISHACCSLGDVSNTTGIAMARATDMIKTTYKDLLEMKKQDLKFIVDAFEFVLDNSDDSCELEVDDEAAAEANSVGSSYDGQHVDYRIVHATTIASETVGGDSNFAGSVVAGSEMSFQSNLSSLHPSIVEEDEEEDSNSDCAFEYDDLRRHTGSSDERDDVANTLKGSLRDPPPETVYHSGKGWTRLYV